MIRSALYALVIMAIGFFLRTCRTLLPSEYYDQGDKPHVTYWRFIGYKGTYFIGITFHYSLLTTNEGMHAGCWAAGVIVYLE